MKNILKKYWGLFLTAVLLILFLANISLGSVQIPISETLKILIGGTPHSMVWSDIILDFRLTKAITCILVGSGLSLGGLLMQTLFRNPLAGPDVLGLSSGSSLAVAIILLIGNGAALFSYPFTIATAASMGSAFIFLLVIAIAHRIKDNTSILIIGLMIGALTSSLVSIMQFSSNTEKQQNFLVWTFGNLGSLNWIEIQILAATLAVGTLLSILSIKALNGWLLGDYYAISIGIDLKRSRLLVIISTSIVTGAVTAFCGPIAFVGLAVPHLTRLIIDTTNHKILIPAVMLMGSVIMLFCDILTQLPGSTYVLPINAVTALIGAPVVISIIMRSKKIRM